MEKAFLIRNRYDFKQTLGTLVIFSDLDLIFHCKTLELSDKNNQQRISCIREGNYNVVKHNSPKFGDTFLLHNVHERSEILIHAGNSYQDTKGCILVGTSFSDINGDGIVDVVNSKHTMNLLNKILKDSFILKVVS